MRNDVMPSALLAMLTVTNATFERISRMYREIAAIFVSFVSFVPFVFKTCTRVCRSYLQTRSYYRKLQKHLRFGIYLHQGKLQ